MSASNVILHTNAGCAFSDAVGIGPSGEVAHLSSKIAVLLRVRAEHRET